MHSGSCEKSQYSTIHVIRMLHVFNAKSGLLAACLALVTIYPLLYDNFKENLNDLKSIEKNNYILFDSDNLSQINESMNKTGFLENLPNAYNLNDASSQLGAIVFLAPARKSRAFNNDRFCLLLQAVKSVDEHLNSHWGPYPILIFSALDYEEDPQKLDSLYTEADINLIRSRLRNSVVHHIQVNMYSKDALEPGFNMSQFERWNQNLDGGIRGTGIGYRAMCRWYSGRLQSHEAMQFFKYYMRLDDDSLFTSGLPYDPFLRMETFNIKYVYRQGMGDYWGINQMWDLARPYMDQSRIANMQEMNFLPHGPNPTYTGSQPYNNFHIATVEMFQRPLWIKYLTDVDKNYGFSKYRFGDANVHAIAMGMLLEPSQVGFWSDIPYGHNTNNFGNAYPPSNWKQDCDS